MSARLTVCGLGPGHPGQVTEATRAVLAGASRTFLRTTRHPTAELAVGGESFDHHYERADSFEEVYQRIADDLVAAATGDDGVVYAVPGSPLVLERTVGLLRADDRVEIELIPAISFLDEVWARLGVDPVDDGVRLIDGHRFAVQAAGERGPLLVAHAHARWVLSDIKLAFEDAGSDQKVVVLQRLGTSAEQVSEVAWPDLDRVVEPDHLTSLYLPEVAAPVAHELARTVEIMHRLRQECPWDRAQTHQSLRPYLIEEAYEVLEAIDSLGEHDGRSDPAPDADAAGPLVDEMSDGYTHLEEELGDLWLQVLFHTELATEAGQFTMADVARGLRDKLVSRHPHVFGEVEVASAEEVRANWERIKSEEKQRDSVLDGIPPGLPALAMVDKMLGRMEREGIEVHPPSPLSDPRPAGGVLSEGDVGRHLLAVAASARASGIDPELALRSAAATLADEFRRGVLPPSWVAG